VKKIIATAALALAALFAFPAAANAADPYPAPPPPDDSQIVVGQATTITFTGYADSDEESTISTDGGVTVANTVVKSVVDNSATVTATFTSAGPASITATAASGYVSTLSFVIAAAPADDLASTGADATPLVWFGGGLLALGVAAVGVTLAVRRTQKVDA